MIYPFGSPKLGTHYSASATKGGYIYSEENKIAPNKVVNVEESCSPRRWSRRYYSGQYNLTQIEEGSECYTNRINLEKHVYQPGFVYVAFGDEQIENIVRDERSLLNKDVKLIIKEAIKIDPNNRRVLLDGGESLEYDYLVIATGSRIVPEEVKGVKGGRHTTFTTLRRQRGCARHLEDSLEERLLV